jgi:hypothetical protein
MKWVFSCFVAIVYAVLQLGINGIIIYKATNGSLSLYFAFSFLLMTFVYLGISNYASSA